MSAELKESRVSRKLHRIGLIVTAAYATAFLALMIFGPRAGWIQMKAISLNELGDLLAGVFGPLSVFWLVLGFFQQGSELRLQVAELSSSVEQQRELVAATRETLEHEKSLQVDRERLRKHTIQPDFVVKIEDGPYRGGEAGWFKHSFTITNVGHDAKNVVVTLQPNTRAALPTRSYWARGASERAELQHDVRDNFREGVLKIEYADQDGTPHTVTFIAKFQDGRMSLFKAGLTMSGHS